MTERHARAKAQLDEVLRQRIDPQEFVRVFNDQAERAMFRRMGQLMGETMLQWQFDCDRDRLIDEARD